MAEIIMKWWLMWHNRASEHHGFEYWCSCQNAIVLVSCFVTVPEGGMGGLRHAAKPKQNKNLTALHQARGGNRLLAASVPKTTKTKRETTLDQARGEGVSRPFCREATVNQ